MPVWHKAAKRWVAEDKLAILAVIQEQHAERCRLFAQWQEFQWPILHDPINVLGCRAVPIVVAIDEHGVVRSTRPKVETFEAEFLNKSFDPPREAATSTPLKKPDLAELQSAAEKNNTSDSWMRLGDQLVLWGGEPRLGEAIDAYRRVLQKSPQDGVAHFRLGVCYRARYESARRADGDFSTAVDHWTTSLEIDPNHYIRRRRIQQYGPRLDKPYPFYDWVEQAQREIRERGQTPIELRERPSGAEIAQPARRFAADENNAQSLDPDGRIQRDSQELIEVETAVVPARIEPGRSVRVHIALRPAAEDAHWNNEAEPLRLWIDAPEGWTLERKMLSAPQPAVAESTEPRRLEFELQSPSDAAGPVELSAYALYYVCEQAGGQCLYLRRDMKIRVDVKQ